jgi:hypothetical protein
MVLTFPDLAPIAVFAYRRIEHLDVVLRALERCPEFKESRVFVWSDGPKSITDKAAVLDVRRFLKGRLRSNMTLVESPSNLGIFRSIVGGVKRLCDEYGKVIVIEDDIVVSPAALTWLNAALRRFSDAENVWQVSAHQHAIPEFAHYSNGLFLGLTTSWGWGTWKRAWDRFDIDASGWEKLRSDASLRGRFDIQSAFPFSAMLENQMRKPIERWDWDIRFWWNVFQAGGVGLFPPRSLVENIGFDGSATHWRMGWLRKHFRASPKTSIETNAPSLPNEIVANQHDADALSRSLRNSRSIWQRRL